jgi:hypothetical protein
MNPPLKFTTDEPEGLFIKSSCSDDKSDGKRLPNAGRAKGKSKKAKVKTGRPRPPAFTFAFDLVCF